MTAPPAAARIPADRTHHGDTVIDEYSWLAGQENPATIAFLEAENAYTGRYDAWHEEALVLAWIVATAAPA